MLVDATQWMISWILCSTKEASMIPLAHKRRQDLPMVMEAGTVVTSWGQVLTRTGPKGDFGVMEMFCLLIWVVITWVYTSVKGHPAVLFAACNVNLQFKACGTKKEGRGQAGAVLLALEGWEACPIYSAIMDFTTRLHRLQSFSHLTLSEVRMHLTIDMFKVAVCSLS